MMPIEGQKVIDGGRRRMPRIAVGADVSPRLVQGKDHRRRHLPQPHRRTLEKYGPLLRLHPHAEGCHGAVHGHLSPDNGFLRPPPGTNSAVGKKFL
jgi:hypothetical protein